MTKTTLKWQLTDLYSGIDDPKIQADFKKCDKLIETLKSYRSKIAGLSEEKILPLIKTWEELAFTFHKIGLFTGLTEATQIGQAEITRFSKKIEEQMILKSQEIIFLEVEFSQLNPQQWQKLLASPILKSYSKFLRHIYEESKHTLSESEEKILAQKSQTSWSALTHLYDITTDTLQFKWRGKMVTLSELSKNLHSPDPAVRKQAAVTFSKGIMVNDKTTPAIFNSLIQDKTISDQLRQYDYPEQARFQNDEVKKETVETLTQVVNQSFGLVEKYYTLKKKILQIDSLYWWDRFAPLPSVEKKIKIEDGKKLVLESFAAFSPEFASIAQTMFDRQHLDWLPSPTKRGGAFCAFGGDGIYPYVLLNYTESPRDVLTLAHELGHAIHDVLAQENNVFFQVHPSLALAEIASTFAESLVLEKLLETNLSKDDQITLMMERIEDIFSTVVRQITMFQFEQKMHQLRRDSGEVSKEEIDHLWHNTMKQPYETSLVYTDEHKNTWMTVSHIFEMPFYVYSYSFAQLCTLALIREYRTKSKDFVPTYIDLLKAGGSLSPENNLNQAGFTITQATFWQKGIEMIKEYIEQLNNLVESH